MNGIAVVGLAVLGLIAAGGIGYWLWKRELARRDFWARWAGERGWTYDHGKDYGIADYFGFVNKLNNGDDRYAQDVLQGRWNDRQAVAFSYHYETEETDSEGERETTDHWMWVTAIQLEREFPELQIAPEHMGKRFVHAFTNSDIDFESVEFSRAYEVKSRDKKFAYDFCNSAMIEFLIANKGATLELEGSWLVTYGNRKLSLENIEPNLMFLSQTRELMPRYLFQAGGPLVQDSTTPETERQQ